MTERIKTLLRSDMPPVQFKLLGTLRMMVDGQGEHVLLCCVVLLLNVGAVETLNLWHDILINCSEFTHQYPDCTLSDFSYLHHFI